MLKKLLTGILTFSLMLILLVGCAGDLKKHTAVFDEDIKVCFSLPEDWFYSVSEADQHIVIADNDIQDYSDGHLLCFIDVFEDSECENIDDFLEKYSPEPASINVGLEVLFENDHIRLFEHTSMTISGTELVSYSGIYYNKKGDFHCQLRPVYLNPDLNTLEKILKSISITN